jgi:peptidoglycan/LPS O-acetylase OafA/YrhL
VAVVAVVAYHAGVGFLAGGYVGVDVFYVISGYLITGLLWREVEQGGGISLAAFYARRARRLLPAAALVLVATMAWAASVLPPLAVRTVWVDGLWCALYAGNFRFAATQTNYLASSSPSPFLHYWSLGVEEQFYLLWPLLLIGVAVLFARRPPRAAAAAALGILAAASLAASVILTRADQPVAFFLLPARAWELATGGLVALATPALRRLPATVGVAAGWSGLAAIVAACVTFSSSTPFPGTAALLPVLGAAGVVAGGLAAPAGGPALLLGRAGPRAVGRISYSWYLWHWPVLVLVPATVGHALAEWEMVGLAAGSGALAALTFRFVETPARDWKGWSTRPARSLVGGLACSGAAVLACAGAGLSIPALQGTGLAPVASIHPAPPSSPPAGTSPATAAGSAPTTTAPASPAAAALSALAAGQAQVEAAVTASAGVRAVPANLTPPLASAASSEAAPMVDGCLQSYTAAAVDSGCLFGDTTSTRTALLFGDSHAAMWFPALDAWADANGWRLYVWTKAACPPVDITLFSPVLDRTWTECQEWYADALAAAATLKPGLAVLGIAPNYDSAYHVTQNGPAWLSGLDHTVSSLRADGASVMVLGSVPSPPVDVPVCLSGQLEDVPACTFSPVGQRVSGGGLVGIDQAGDRAEAATVAQAGGFYLDVDPWFCTSTVCDVIVDNLLVYRDNSHITVPYAQYLSPLVSDGITATLAGAT